VIFKIKLNHKCGLVSDQFVHHEQLTYRLSAFNTFDLKNKMFPLIFARDVLNIARGYDGIESILMRFFSYCYLFYFFINFIV